MDNSDFRCFRLERDARGVVTAWLDVPDQGMNVFTEAVLRELDRLLTIIAGDSSVRVLVIRSAKKSGFLAGADIRTIRDLPSPAEAERICEIGQGLFRRLEQLPIPTVAVIHGPCLGGGLEFALSCKYRIAVDDSRTKLGLPEVELGLLPAWGGTQRLPERIGLVAALPMLLTGKKLSAAKAKKAGLVEAVATPETVDADVAKFVDQLLSGMKPATHDFTLAERLRDRTKVGQWLVMKTARKQIASNRAHYPALAAILEAVGTGLRRGRDEGFATERHKFGELLFTNTSRSLVGLFFQREAARNNRTWIENPDIQPATVRKVGVIGGGTMGAGIAQLAASQGFPVVLKEVDEKFLTAGMDRIRKLFDDAVSKQVMRQAEATSKLSLLMPTTAWEPFREVDLAIEAVPEQMSIKQEVFRELDRHTPETAVLASNTSALNIAEMAEAAGRAQTIAGLHFFNPVHRMQLVEVVTTGGTNEQTVATLVEFVRKLGKVPVVVANSPGFLVNRILFPYLDEAVRMSCEGVPTEDVDKAFRRFGMPMGPLELLDQVGIDVAAHVAQTLVDQSRDPSPTPDRLAAMVKDGRLGTKSGVGFYFHSDGKKTKPAQWDKVETADRVPILSYEDIQRRGILLIINEAVHCLEERVAREPWMVDLGMVLGTGFAPFYGGPLRLADLWGIPHVVEQLERFQKSHGARFTPANRLCEMRQRNETFYPKTTAPMTNRETPSELTAAR